MAITYLKIQTKTVNKKKVSKTGWIKPQDNKSGDLHVTTEEGGIPRFHRGEQLLATQKLILRTTQKKGAHHVAELKEEDMFEILEIVVDTDLQVQTKTVDGKDMSKTGWIKPLDKSGHSHVMSTAVDPAA